MRLAQFRQGEMAVLLALALVMLPLLLYLPPWLPVLVLTMLLVRGFLLQRQYRLPSLWLLLPLLGLSIGGIWLNLNTLIGREGGAALLILLLGFKSFESRQQRDWQVLLALGFFLAAIPLLFDQSPPSALWLIISLLALTWAMLRLAGGAVPGTAGMAAQALLLSLPLMLVLFVVMPRLPGPLWSMPHEQHVASTGLSDSMEPGSISQLVQQQEPAFSVVFNGPPPAHEQLYWRIMIFDDFDGRRWQSVHGQMRERMQLAGGEKVRYRLTGKPSRSRLPLLDYPLAAPAEGKLEPGGLFKLANDQDDMLRIAGESLVGSRYLSELSRSDQDFYRHLPPGNPASRQLAMQWRSQSSDSAGFVREALLHFRLGGFAYTLRPPLLEGDNSIDAFMFATRQGFCEHYASAFAFMARAAGIPARVVTGYQGGQFNPLGRFWQVRSSDAHAWVEVWLAERGEWLRVDPTAAVAPERVSKDLGQSIPAMQAQLPVFGSRMPTWMVRVQQGWQAAGFVWQQWVVGYDASRQLSLYRWLGLGDAVDSTAVVRGLLGGVVLAGLPLLWWWRRSPERLPLQEGRVRLERALRQQGITLLPSDGPLDMLNKARGLPAPAYRELKQLCKEYAAMRYQNPALSQQQARLWLRRVRAFSTDLARGKLRQGG
jgi:transglutaminase-like putative cysteine protease